MAVSGAEVRALDALVGSQAAASAPDGSVWLSASAGTGKTHVLASRVFRLLLRGVDPGAILCLTFTKAGAAEMAARVNGRLAYWVRAKRGEIANDLAALGEDFGPERVAFARTLFAKVLDAPGGGLRIQTIHSFCQTLLSSFPIEAGLTPGFRPLEAREETALARDTLAAMLADAGREGRDGLIDAVGALSLRLGEGKAEAFLHACAKAPDAMAALPSGIQPWLRRAMGLPQGDVLEEAARWCADDNFDVEGLRRIADANYAWGTATGTEAAAVAEAWLAADSAARVAMLGELKKLVLTAKDEPKKVSSRLAALDPDYEMLAAELGEACIAVAGMIARAGYADLLAQGLTAGREYAAAYAQAKRRAGAVDFDDLIGRTVALLDQPGMGDWIRFKLDQVTSHVLIDEAQDTNIAQWRIVRALADEFFAGEGAHGEEVRTLFTVGDYKQAIFGFQGTDPVNFAAAHVHFRERSAGALETLSLTHSFRSTAPILEFVDAAVAALPEPGMGTESETHASRVAGPGTVTLWPPVVAGGDPEDEEGWIDDATREVASRIARQIKAWVGTLELESKGRTLRPEDVMILVKRRGELASLLVARLHAEGVPVAGVDRLRLNAPLAVQDLLAAVRFALQPDDDLSLAALLVSPLIGWSQDELMHAAMRERGSLWRHLRATLPDARLAPLYGLLARADLMTPHRFLETILSGEMDGRRKLLRRLGREALDPIEELLTAALGFEGLATPTLQRFLDWFDRGDVEIVRDAAQPQDAVRVMTAHGAKGLQAPLVILADATADPQGGNRGGFVKWAPEGHDGPAFPIFRPGKAERGGRVDATVALADARELEEHWRLFYVAATRAEERLVIAGAIGPKAKGEAPAASWYAASRAAFDALGVADDENERTFIGSRPQPPIARKPRGAPVTEAAVELPGWVRAPAPVEARPPRPLAPSSLGDDLVADPPPGPALRAAAERGRLIHALLERLPAVAIERRAEAADRWLAGAGGVADASARAELAAAALGVLADSRFAALFGSEALAEAPIAAVVAGGHVVSGTADRLLVTGDRVLVVDFKTGRRAPASLDEVPPYHVRQMAAYVAALEVVFPGRRVEAGLLYTATPVLFALPDDLVAAHKPGFVATEQSLSSNA
ncbi:double-strand break repair helicase AddA [Sphingomonas sp. BT-65]|uniref:double-strand break repair helicase AddA n=1 Tax=Sphingomonas sp. BT-65 TaxID=2989821 RepID=UPI00223564C8|nr:double-strand break repair helicase AddA [Sphingomonas sp. BT-65]MCW4460184.1 double-strand break repair helicase AddA [Sphingomonas sp. BT-65]